ncbi:MAG: hypothetical protein AB4060_00200 [Crocosphaera sp.]
MLADDSNPPDGVQFFFPFTTNYFAFPIPILGRLTFTGGIIQLNNFLAVLQETVVISLLSFVILLIVKKIKKDKTINN